MSTGKRAYDMLRGYVHREWERIQGVEQSLAQRELEESLHSSPSASTPTAIPQEPRTPEGRRERARSLLGVSKDASFPEVRRQFERLEQRSDPDNFPTGSPERREATELQKRVRWAYQVLSDEADATEKRFASLEIDPE